MIDLGEDSLGLGRLNQLAVLVAPTPSIGGYNDVLRGALLLQTIECVRDAIRLGTLLTDLRTAWLVWKHFLHLLPIFIWLAIITIKPSFHIHGGGSLGLSRFEARISAKIRFVDC